MTGTKGITEMKRDRNDPDNQNNPNGYDKNNNSNRNDQNVASYLETRVGN